MIRLGLVADSESQLSNLRELVNLSGYGVAISLLAPNLCIDDGKSWLTQQHNNIPEPDVWVVRIDMHLERSLAILEILEDRSNSVVYDDAEIYESLSVQDMSRRFSRKVNACFNDNVEQSPESKKAQKVWVLGASTGGLEAVVTFLKGIPKELEKVAFLYVQHIDGRMKDSLLKVVARNTDWEVCDTDTAQRINEKSLYLVSPDHQVDIDDMGNLVPVLKPWGGPYSPSVDQVVAKIARNFGRDSGVIIFSGMGDDGAKASRLISLAGGAVWVQAPQTCAVDSMPRETMVKDIVSFIGTPELLAKEFVGHINGVANGVSPNLPVN